MLFNNVGFQTFAPQDAQGMNPDAYAQKYAEQNGISVDEAKTQLQSKYGDPKQKQNSDNSINFASSQTPQIDPDSMLKMYMQANNVSEEVAKAQLEAIYGKPEQNGSFNMMG